MPQRNQHLQIAANALSRVEQRPANAVRYMQEMVVALLSPQQKQVYEYVNAATDNITPQHVAAQFGWSMSYSSTLLKDLYEVGLLERTEHRDEIGRVYQYKVKGWGAEFYID